MIIVIDLVVRLFSLILSSNLPENKSSRKFVQNLCQGGIVLVLIKGILPTFDHFYVCTNCQSGVE